MLASRYGHVDIVKLLLEHNANVDIVNKVSCFIIMNALVSTSSTFLVSFDLFAYGMCGLIKRFQPMIGRQNRNPLIISSQLKDPNRFL